MLSVDIQDEGVGIPKESLPHLLLKFYRVDNSIAGGLGERALD